MKAAALVLGQVAVLATWLYAEFDIGWLFFAAYLFVPWALLAFGFGSLGTWGRAVAIVLVSVMTVVMYEAIWTSDSSTAPLGFLWLPLYQLVAIGAVVALQPRSRSAPKN